MRKLTCEWVCPSNAQSLSMNTIRVVHLLLCVCSPKPRSNVPRETFRGDEVCFAGSCLRPRQTLHSESGVWPVWSGRFVWCCRCGARAATFAQKLGEPCAGQPRSQEYARSIRCSLRKHEQGGSKATSGRTATKLGWPSSNKQRIRAAEAQPADPVDKKHFLLPLWCAR